MPMQLSWDDYDTDAEETAGVIADLAVRDLAVREGAEPPAAPVEPANAGLDMAPAVEPAVPEPPPFVAPPRPSVAAETPTPALAASAAEAPLAEVVSRRRRKRPPKSPLPRRPSWTSRTRRAESA